MRFLVDENLPAGVAELLCDAGHDAVAVARSTHRGASDATLREVASREGRIVLTRDLGFPVSIGPQGPPGLVLIRLPSRSRRAAIVRAVQQLLWVVRAEDLTGHVTVVEPGRVRRRSLAALVR